MVEHRKRLESALEGGVETPPVAGISFVPSEALMGSGAAGAEDPAEILAATVRDLALDFAFVPAREAWAREAVALLREGDFGVMWVVDGPLWRTLDELGFAEGLKATAWDPRSLEPSLDRETARAQDEIMRGAELDIDAVVVTDDVAGTTGPLVSPDYFNEMLVERYALAVATAASAGTRAVFHSDGDIRAFLASIARAGFIGVHSGGGLEQEAFENLLLATREQGLALLGGLDTSRLREGSASAVRMGTRAGMLASAGGLIVADDGGITTAQEMGALSTALGSAGIGA